MLITTRLIKVSKRRHTHRKISSLIKGVCACVCALSWLVLTQRRVEKNQVTEMVHVFLFAYLKWFLSRLWVNRDYECDYSSHVLAFMQNHTSAILIILHLMYYASAPNISARSCIEQRHNTGSWRTRPGMWGKLCQACWVTLEKCLHLTVTNKTVFDVIVMIMTTGVRSLLNCTLAQL